MNPLFNYIVTETARRHLRKKGKAAAKKEFAREFREVRVEYVHLLRDSFLILLGIASATFGLKGFLLPNSFIDGGITGISLIIAEVTTIPLSVLLVAINLPFVLLGLSTIGRQFAIRSIIAIFLLALAVHTFAFPPITEDKLLIAVFGGFFLGLGIGLAIRGGAVIDGTEVLAVYLSKRTSMTIGDIILVFNVFIFSVAAYVFSIDVALYAILTYLAAAKTVDFVVSGIEEYIGVTIISEQQEEIRLAIIERLGRACTIYSGKRGYAKRGETLRKTDIIYTLVTRLELAKLKTEVDKIDPDAFLIMHSIKDAKGGMIKKRPLK